MDSPLTQQKQTVYQYTRCNICDQLIDDPLHAHEFDDLFQQPGENSYSQPQQDKSDLDVPWEKMQNNQDLINDMLNFKSLFDPDVNNWASWEKIDIYEYSSILESVMHTIHIGNAIFTEYGTCIQRFDDDPFENVYSDDKYSQYKKETDKYVKKRKLSKKQYADNELFKKQYNTLDIYKKKSTQLNKIQNKKLTQIRERDSRKEIKQKIIKSNSSNKNSEKYLFYSNDLSQEREIWEQDHGLSFWDSGSDDDYDQVQQERMQNFEDNY